MRKIYLSLLILTGLFLNINAEAQIKIGTNGATISPASLLELESNNQGLLIPRMATTTAIDGLNPPIGMMVYITTEPSGIYIKKAAGWEYLTGFLGGVANFNSITVTGAVTAGSFSGPLTGNATTATTALNATNSANSTVTNDISNPAVTYPVFVNSTPGNQPLRTSSGNLSYIPATGILTARGFAGPLTGDVTGNATSAVDAQNTVNLRITNDLVTPTTMYPTFVGGTSGPLPARVSSTRLSFIPLTGELTAPIFRGNLLGNATSATTVTGVVNAPNGGTGQTIYTPGDILYADASNTLAKLPIGVTGTILRVDASNRPSWSTAGAGTVTNVTGVANRISVVDPTVAPVIDIDVNYTGQASINTLGTVITGTWNAGVIPSTYGGTGVATLTTNELLVGGGAGNPIGSISLIGSAGKVLTSNGVNALPTFETAGIGNMVLGVDQIVNAPKRFTDGSLLVRGTGTGETTLRVDANSVGVASFPAGSYTLVGTTGTQTLSGKTFTNGTIFQGTTTLDIISNTSQTTTGNITAGSFTGPLTGNVTGNVSGSAATFTTNLAGDVTGPQGTTLVTRVGGQLAANVASGSVIANTATALLVPSSVVQRDASNNFAAGIITASLNGNATNVTGVVMPANGGTGINNGTNTITVQGNISHLGAFTQTLRAPGANSDVTLPETGILYSDRANSITSASLAGALTNETGFNPGAFAVFSDGPAFTGAPTATTAPASTNSTRIATTAYADGAVATLGATKQNTLVNSAGLAAALSDETGTGLAVFSTSPVLVTPTLGAATATTINGNTISNGTGTLTLAAGSTLATSGGSITLTSASPSNVTLPASGTLVAALSATGLIDFNSTAAGQSSDSLTDIAVATAALGDVVALGVSTASMAGGGTYTAWVSGAGTVRIRFTNTTGLAVDPNAETFNVKVFK